jgi:hypothetical protein
LVYIDLQSSESFIALKMEPNNELGLGKEKRVSLIFYQEIPRAEGVAQVLQYLPRKL